MKNSIKCCISCILPCGILDVIRIVHSNGRVEELSHPVRASDILDANPKHVLRKASSDGVVPRIVLVPPEAELQRGRIYFLMPVAAAAPQKPRGRRKKRRDAGAVLVSDDQYLSEILSEKAAMPRERRRGRVGVWRPHLESIAET